MKTICACLGLRVMSTKILSSGENHLVRLKMSPKLALMATAVVSLVFGTPAQAALPVISVSSATLNFTDAGMQSVNVTSDQPDQAVSVTAV